jgi:hypothetical protein
MEKSLWSLPAIGTRRDTDEFGKPKLLFSSVEGGDEKLPPFLDKQKSKLLQVRDSVLDLMTGVSRDTLRSRAEDNEAVRTRNASG